LTVTTEAANLKLAGPVSGRRPRRREQHPRNSLL